MSDLLQNNRFTYELPPWISMLSLPHCFFTFRFVQLLIYSPNSRCRPPSCLPTVFSMFLAIISPSSSCSSYSWNEWNVRHHDTKTTQPRPQVFSVNGALTCSGLHFWRHFLVKHKILPNLVISNWLWWIMYVLLANQSQGNIVNE